MRLKMIFAKWFEEFAKKKSYELNLIIVASVIKTFSYFFCKIHIGNDIHRHSSSSSHLISIFTKISSHTADNFLGNDSFLINWMSSINSSTIDFHLAHIWEILMIIQQHEKFSLFRGIWLILMIINEWWVEGWEARIQTITAACMRYLFFY